jgi:hypothetical protein
VLSFVRHLGVLAFELYMSEVEFLGQATAGDDAMPQSTARSPEAPPPRLASAG